MGKKDPPEVVQLFDRIAELVPRAITLDETLYRLYETLIELVDPDSLGGWFMTPNGAFDGLKPIEVIERGEIDRLWEMAFRLRSGMPG
jgi:hypothetical protein